MPSELTTPTSVDFTCSAEPWLLLPSTLLSVGVAGGLEDAAPDGVETSSDTDATLSEPRVEGDFGPRPPPPPPPPPLPPPGGLGEALPPFFLGGFGEFDADEFPLGRADAGGVLLALLVLASASVGLVVVESDFASLVVEGSAATVDLPFSCCWGFCCCADRDWLSLLVSTSAFGAAEGSLMVAVDSVLWMKNVDGSRPKSKKSPF